MSLRLRLLLTLAPLFIIGLAAADSGTYAALQTPSSRASTSSSLPCNPVSSTLLQNPNEGPNPRGGPGQQDSFPAGTYGEIISADRPYAWLQPVLRRLRQHVVVTPGVPSGNLRRLRQLDSVGRRHIPVVSRRRHTARGAQPAVGKTGRRRAARRCRRRGRDTQHAAPVRDCNQQRYHDHRAGRTWLARATRHASARAHGCHSTINRRERTRQLAYRLQQRRPRSVGSDLRSTRCSDRSSAHSRNAMSPSRSCAISSRMHRTSCAPRSRPCAGMRSCCSGTPI